MKFFLKIETKYFEIKFSLTKANFDELAKYNRCNFKN